MIRFLLLALTICLVGCGSSTPAPSGSAIEHAAAVNARAATTATAADAAQVDAAAKAGKATALETAAKADPTPARIQAAVDARVEAASAAAVAKALAEVAAKANADAKGAEDAARQERIALAKADDLRHLQWICWIIGLAATIGGAILGGALFYATKQLSSLLWGGAIMALGQAVTFYGATVTWLPWLVVAAFVIVVVTWSIKHRKDTVKSDLLSLQVTHLQSKIMESLFRPAPTPAPIDAAPAMPASVDLAAKGPANG